MATKKGPAVEEPVVEQEIVEEKEEMVSIRLPLIPGVEKQEALYVGVNDRSWVIPRGKEMQVPRCVVEVIEHSEEEAMNAELFRHAHTV